MRNIAVIFVLLLLPVNLLGQNIWEQDSNHSTLGFSVLHLGIAEVPGHFDDYNVTITTAEEDFSDAQVELTVQTASVYTRVKNRDDHLRNEDFFHVEEYPSMTFVSNSIRKIEDGKFELTGDLTLLEVTKEVTVTLQHRGTIEHPSSGAPVAGIQIFGTIDRRDFGFGSGFPPPAISNQVTIKADGEFRLK